MRYVCVCVCMCMYVDVDVYICLRDRPGPAVVEPEVAAQGSTMIVHYLHKFGEAYRSGALVLEAMKLRAFPGDCSAFMRPFGPLNPAPLRHIHIYIDR